MYHAFRNFVLEMPLCSAVRKENPSGHFYEESPLHVVVQ